MDGPGKTAEEIMGEIQKLCQMIDRGEESDSSLDNSDEHLPGRIAQEVWVAEKLSEQVNLLQSILGAMRSGLSIRDLDYTVTYQNDVITDVFGDCRGEKCYKAFEGRDEICEGCPVELAYKDGQSHTSVRKVVSPSGETMYWENTANPIRDDEGNIVSCLEICEDITKRKRNEERLGFLSTITEQVADSVITTDLDFKITYTNHAFQELYGYARDELIGQSPGVLNVSPDSEEVQQDIYKTVSSGKVWRGEVQNRRNDGSTFSCEMAIFPLKDEEGNIVAYGGTQRDVSPRERIEEELRTTQMHYTDFINSSSDAVGYWRVPDGLRIDLPVEEQIEMLRHSVCLDANKEAWEAFGFKSKDELIGKEYIELVAETTVDEALSEFIRHDYRLNNHETRAIGLDGREYYGLDNWYGVVEDGVLTHVWASSRVITERRIAEEKLKTQQYYLQKAQEMGTIGTWELDIKKNKLIWTDENYRIFGLPPDTKLKYETFLDCVHPDDRGYVDGKWKAAQQEKEAYDIEHRIIVGDGVKWVREKAELEFGENGECIRGIGFTQDITERKRMERELRTTQMHYTDFINSSRDLVSYWKVPEGLKADLPVEEQIEVIRHSICLDLNKANWEAYGFDNKEEVLGKEYSELVKDSTIADAVAEFIKGNYRLGNYELYETYPDGRECYALDNWYGVVEGGVLTHIWASSKDITEQKKAEAALRAERDRAQGYFDIAAVIMLVLGADGTVELVNEKGCKILGYQESEILGKDWFDNFLPKQINKEIRSVFDKLIGGDIEPVEYFENPVLLKNGSEKLIAWHNTPLRDHTGYIIGVLSSGEDITDRKKAEAELTRLIAILENTSDMISTATPDEQLTYINSAGRKLLGWDDDEVITNKKIRDVHPQWASELIESEGIATAIRDGVWSGETALLSRNGKEIPISQVIMSHKSPDGQLQYLSTIIRDITDHKRAEETLRQKEETIRALVETSQDMIWEIDLEGVHTYCNPAIEEILGWRLDEFVGRPSVEFMHEQDRRMVEEKLPDWIAQKSGWRNVVIRWRHKDGSYRFLESNCVPIIDFQGELVGFRGVDRDITERRQAEEELKRHQAELSHMWRVNTMGEMASGLAHELNQPLCAIANFANACRRIMDDRPNESEDLVSALGEISGQADRAGQIIRRLRNLVAKGEPRQSTVCVNDIVEEVLEMEKAEALDQSIGVQKELSNDLPEIVADPIQIEQVVLNIVRNAFDAMAKTKPEMRRIVIRTSVKQDGSVEVAVGDTGVGFVSDIGEKVFEPFFTTKAKGLGVGLSLSRSIIEAHGGKLWAESNPDCGATFKFILPVKGQAKSSDDDET